MKDWIKVALGVAALAAVLIFIVASTAPRAGAGTCEAIQDTILYAPRPAWPNEIRSQRT